VDFEVVGDISRIRTIAIGKRIRELPRLRKSYGPGRWKKRKALVQCTSALRKGRATVRLSDGTIWATELHWYEAHGIGRREMKIKRRLEALS